MAALQLARVTDLQKKQRQRARHCGGRHSTEIATALCQCVFQTRVGGESVVHILKVLTDIMNAPPSFPWMEFVTHTVSNKPTRNGRSAKRRVHVRVAQIGGASRADRALHLPRRPVCDLSASPNGKVHDAMRDELWTHARIRLHDGKTKLWNRRRLLPQGCADLAAFVRVPAKPRTCGSETEHAHHLNEA